MNNMEQMITHVIPTVLHSLPRDAKGPNQIAFAHEYVVNENMKYELWNCGIVKNCTVDTVDHRSKMKKECP